MRLRDIAAIVNGEIQGDQDLEIHGAAGIHDVKEGEITFLSNRALASECIQSKASCVLVKDFTPELKRAQVKVKNPRYAFAQMLEHFSPPLRHTAGISALASVSSLSTVSKDATVYPFVTIEDNAVIGDHTVLYPGVFIGNGTIIGNHSTVYPGVTIREKVQVGSRVIIHPGAIIGSDGFGYVLEEGRHHKIPQVGGVIIGDDVEIGANVTIDRATTGNTVIGKGTKIDNLVQIGHNVKIGENVILVAQVAIGGSTSIGNYVVLGGQVAIADHTVIDDGCMFVAKSGTFGHISKGVYSGSPAIPHREWLKSSALFAKLPDLHKRIRELEEKVKLLERSHQ